MQGEVPTENPEEPSAQGGQTIASAPAVAYGQLESGGPAGFRTPDCNGTPVIGGFSDYGYWSWWTAPVVAGDVVTVDWQAQPGQDSSGNPRYWYRVQAFPAGTNDFTVADTNQVLDDIFADRATIGQFSFRASVSGSMPFVFLSDSCAAPGPYAFTASVSHGLLVSLQRFTRVHRTSKVSVAVDTPDGAAVPSGVNVQVQLYSNHRWSSVGSAPVSNGWAVVQLHLPRSVAGEVVSLRAYGTGSGYRGAVSRSTRARVH